MLLLTATHSTMCVCWQFDPNVRTKLFTKQRIQHGGWFESENCGSERRLEGGVESADTGGVETVGKSPRHAQQRWSRSELTPQHEQRSTGRADLEFVRAARGLRRLAEMFGDPDPFEKKSLPLFGPGGPRRSLRRGNAVRIERDLMAGLRSLRTRTGKSPLSTTRHAPRDDASKSPRRPAAADNFGAAKRELHTHYDTHLT